MKYLGIRDGFEYESANYTEQPDDASSKMNDWLDSVLKMRAQHEEEEMLANVNAQGTLVCNPFSHRNGYPLPPALQCKQLFRHASCSRLQTFCRGGEGWRAVSK